MSEGIFIARDRMRNQDIMTMISMSCKHNCDPNRQQRRELSSSRKFSELMHFEDCLCVRFTHEYHDHKQSKRLQPRLQLTLTQLIKQPTAANTIMNPSIAHLLKIAPIACVKEELNLRKLLPWNDLKLPCYLGAVGVDNSEA